MSAVALIKFVQGATVGPDGQMIVGVTGNFTVQNSNNTGVGSWQIDQVFVPPGSALTISTPYAFNDASSTPSAVVPSDVSGCWRYVLSVWASPGRSGPPTDVDIRIFGIREPRGTLIPPSQLVPPPLPIESGKPDEFNLNGNASGWAGNGSGDGLLNDTLKKLDAGLFGGTGTINVDVVVTSNDSLTGTATRDGVALVANTTRILTTSQTDPTKSLIWVAQTGAWTMAGDFDTDAEIKLGQLVYVKSGTLGGGKTFRLKSGTLALAKTWEIMLLTPHPPVRLVQTKALPAYTYDATAKTYTQNTNTAFDTTYFDGIVPSVGNDLALVLEPTGSRNGPVTVVQLGNGTVPNILKRRPDADTSSDFVGGVQLDVLDGATAGGNYKGTRWYMTNVGTVTLDTTATTWAQMRPKGSTIDLSLPPYFVRDAQDYAHAVDCGPALKQFLYDYRGIPVTGVLPSSNGGWIIVNNQLPHGGGVLLKGAGRDQSTIAVGNNLSGGGPIVVAQNLPNPSGGNGFPSIGGTRVDSAGDSPLSFWRDTAGATDKEYYYNLSDAGLVVDDWAAFELRALVRFETLTDPGGSNSQHIISCRGRAVDLSTSELFKITFNKTTHLITSTLRITDTTKGVYGATVGTNVGGGTSVVAGDATITPTEDAPNFTVRVKVGGTIGVSGIILDYATDGFRFGPEIALGTATSLSTVAREVNDHAQVFAAKITFLAGTLVAGASYKVPCSGVNTTVTSMSTTVIAININYEILLQYDGSNVRFQVSTADGATARETVIPTAATGVVSQRWWEFTHLGRGQNVGTAEGSFDLPPITAWLGSIRFLNGGILPPSGAAATTIDKDVQGMTNASVTNQKLRWQPKASQLSSDPGGNPVGYTGETEISRGLTQINPRSPFTGPQMSGGGFQGLSFYMGGDASNRGMGLVSQAWLDRSFKDLGFKGGLHGWSNIGPDFGSIDDSLVFNTGVIHTTNGVGVAMRWVQGALTATGAWQFQNGGDACWLMTSVASVTATGGFFMNGEQLSTRCGMVHDRMLTSVFSSWIFDGENQQNHQSGREMARIYMGIGGASLKISGGVSGAAERYSVITEVSDAGRGPIEFDNFTLSGIVMPPISVYRPDGPIVYGTATANFPGLTVPICDRTNKFMRVGGSLGPVLIPDAGPVPSWFRGIVVKLPAATITANRNYTLDITSMQVGDHYRVLVEPQTGGFTVQFTNGGRAGGSLLSTALAAGAEGAYTFRLNEAFNLERV